MIVLTQDFEPWDRPPLPHAASGALRKIGVEIEFNGINAEIAARVVQSLFGGRVAPDTRHRLRVSDTTFGTFVCELDAAFAHRPIKNRTVRGLRDGAASLSAGVLPIEVVCPPIPLTSAHQIDRLVATLADAGAVGTSESFFYAFGLQLNPELPALDIHTVLSTFRAFLILRGWLRRAIDVDPSRMLWSFERPFPESYVGRVLDPRYRPTLAMFTEDYLAANPTRNRELDLLPLLAHLSPVSVRAALPAETINARPTWHYRLPNADLGAPGWRVGLEWSRWLCVERLAMQPDLLNDGARRVLRDGPEASVDDLAAAP